MESRAAIIDEYVLSAEEYINDCLQSIKTLMDEIAAASIQG